MCCLGPCLRTARPPRGWSPRLGLDCSPNGVCAARSGRRQRSTWRPRVGYADRTMTNFAESLSALLEPEERAEGQHKVRGAARYAADASRPGMLWSAILY